MKKITAIFIALTLLTLGTSCAKKVIDVKSPCVSSEDGPCGPKHPINDWWLKNSQNNHKQNS